MRFHSYKFKIKHKTGSLIFAHWLIMGRSRKWPDLRSPISKIKDIHFVGTDDLITFLKFHNFSSNTVAGARLYFFFVRYGHLTWPGDLTLHDPGSKLSQKLPKRWEIRYVKIRRRCAPPFSCYPRKTAGGGGGGAQTPPSRAKVKSMGI